VISEEPSLENSTKDMISNAASLKVPPTIYEKVFNAVAILLDVEQSWIEIRK